MNYRPQKTGAEVAHFTDSITQLFYALKQFKRERQGNTYIFFCEGKLLLLLCAADLQFNKNYFLWNSYKGKCSIKSFYHLQMKEQGHC